MALNGCATTATPAPVVAAVPAAPVGVPPGMQFLYGSGEAAALSYQAYQALAATIIARAADRRLGRPVPSVVLAAGATLEAPVFAPCGDRPLAVVFDVDETALLNLGFEASEAQRAGPYDQSRWERWERTGAAAVIATPGMAEVARAARDAGVTMVFNTNRMAANAAQTELALTGAGLGPVAHGRNLWLQGDAGPGSGKDARRWAIAALYCVVAMAGDQLGDFSDLFNAGNPPPAIRRALTASGGVRSLWGSGWFILPNPVYGTGLKGSLDQVFPADRRWTDPGPDPAPAPKPAAP
ncbi:HAD family acid phosphatase [uncultured Sphingomonas sp.]|uniref:HAD family acid phosphatase n=1 Tax=uncultured Sphingomonas sp. TaxID=158754 RepID=UPI0035CB783B